MRERIYIHPAYRPWKAPRISLRWLLILFALGLAYLIYGAPSEATDASSLVWVDSCEKCDLTSPVEAYRLAAGFRAKWLRFGFQGMTFWPLGQRVVLTLKDGSQVSSLAVMGVGPFDTHGRPIRLGIVSRWLHQDELEQGHRGRGGLVLAAFPDSAMTSRITAVRLEGGKP